MTKPNAARGYCLFYFSDVVAAPRFSASIGNRKMEKCETLQIPVLQFSRLVAVPTAASSLYPIQKLLSITNEILSDVV
jgi:hypothetical protein